ncbi:expressed unknown protein [Seminavis robusta]|uniref:Uncharacterized protein n=1 Tax=Seminavis robusta TaxID=568900 RepID=A0A9N8EIH2_9STRA|nr:expressed unknown protein [Seminavis robusta]|eukprot:Sro1223_g253910.1 n/a (103) ;mRNA; r:15959-16492
MTPSATSSTTPSPQPISAPSTQPTPFLALPPSFPPNSVERLGYDGEPEGTFPWRTAKVIATTMATALEVFCVGNGMKMTLLLGVSEVTPIMLLLVWRVLGRL